MVCELSGFKVAGLELSGWLPPLKEIFVVSLETLCNLVYSSGVERTSVQNTMACGGYRKFLALTLSTRSLERFILLPLRAATDIVSCCSASATCHGTVDFLVRAGKAFLLHLCWALVSIMSFAFTFVANYVT